MVSTRSVAVAPSGRRPDSRQPTTGGISIELGWPSIAASASMPPTPQPTTPRPLTIVVCESVPKQVSGNATPSSTHDHARQVLDVHLVHDAGLGRHHAEVAERILAPAQEHITLAVAVVLEAGIELERIGGAEVVDLHRVVDDQFHRLQRVDARRVAAERGDAVAHRRQIDHAGHAGEILQQHAGRHERDLAVGVGRRRIPAGQGADVVGLHESAVLAPQQVLEEDAQRERQPRHCGEVPGQRRQAEVVDGTASRRQGGARVEGVLARHDPVDHSRRPPMTGHPPSAIGQAGLAAPSNGGGIRRISPARLARHS